MQRPPRLCSCGRTVPAGQPCSCRVQREADRKAKLDAARPSAGERGYDADWKRCRSGFLKKHFVCQQPGCNRPATEADHIVSVRERPDLRLRWSNLRALCKAHHSQRTAREQGFASPLARPSGRLDHNKAEPGGRVEALASDHGTAPPSLARDTGRFSMLTGVK